MDKKNIVRLIVLISLILMMAVTFLIIGTSHITAAITHLISTADVSSAALFILIYMVATVLCLPGSFFTLLGGLVFGAKWGFLANMTGASLGALCAFLMSRYVMSDWVRARMNHRGSAIVEGINKEGWRFVAFVRLVPLFPFNFSNYALGLTNIKLSHYMLASVCFIAPGVMAYTYVGSLGQNALARDVKILGQRGPWAVAIIVAVMGLSRLVVKYEWLHKVKSHGKK